MTRVLLVDDDLDLCAMQAEYLTIEGYEVVQAHDGETAVHHALSESFDIMLLDVILPKLNGAEVLRKVRGHSQVPILMLTAKGDDIDRILGLELGADDYVAKPCTPRELVARIRAILRRSQPQPQGLADHQIGSLRLAPSRRLAFWDEQVLDLTSTEFNLLEVLARHAGRAVSKEELSSQVLGRSLTRYDRSIDVHISNLRQKLGLLSDGRSPIQTIRGLGYQLLAA
ncbi:MAG: response regulator [Aeromonadaceae bacterium]|nr:response regulator [Aeromonadaceae bacterium]